MSHRYVRKVISSVAFYPITVMYLAAVAVLSLVVASVLRLDAGVLLLGLVAVFLIIATVQREVEHFHKIMDDERDLCIARIELLAQTLRDHGINVPEDYTEQEER